MYAIAFLAALASLKTGVEMNAKGPSHYAMLGVTRSSNPLEIKRAYKKLSLTLHPDKNPSPNAVDEFDALKQSYDVLMDMELREVYNKFGAEGIASNKRFDETSFFLELGVFYVTWGVMAYLLTMGKKSGDARQWTFTALICMVVMEITLMTSENVLPKQFFPQTTEYEAVWLLHSLFPAFMNGCRSLGAFLYVDLEANAQAMLLGLQEQNKDILLALREVQIIVQGIQTNGVAGGNRVNVNPSTANLSVGEQPSIRVTPTGKLKELQERLQQSNANANALDQLKSGGNQKSQAWGFYTMIIGYVVISYIFNGSK